MCSIRTAWKTVKVIVSSSISNPWDEAIIRKNIKYPNQLQQIYITRANQMNERLTKCYKCLKCFFFDKHLLFRIDYESTLKKFNIHIRIAFNFTSLCLYADQLVAGSYFKMLFELIFVENLK